MVERINGAAVPNEPLTQDLDFFLVRTLVDITPTGNFADNSQKAFEKLMETISLRAQPVIIGSVITTNETNPPDLPAASGTVTVYNLKFAIEHTKAWDNVDISLADSLNGIAGFVHTTPSTNNNVAITKTDFLQ